jgi:amino acid transporter
MSSVTNPAGSAAGSPRASYTRKSSGMVREVSLIDMIVYGAAAPGGIGITLVIGLFFVFAAFPGANLYVALPIAFALVGAVWITFALLAATFPRAGGDYLYASRVIHPVVGLTSNIAVFASSLLGVGFWGGALVSIGIGPTFVIIGLTTGNSWWVSASETLSQKGWQFVIAIVFIVAVSALCALRTKVVARVMTWSFAIAFVGFLVAVIVMIVTSHNSFINAVNDFSEAHTGSADTYNDTIAAGAELGLQYPSESGYSFRGTIGAIIVGLNIGLFYYWGIYMAGEMKGAGRRSRQLTAMLTAGYGQYLLVILTAFLFVGTAGYNFFAAANTGAYAVPVAPYYNFFAALAGGSTVLSIIMAITFLCFIPPALYILITMVQRALFAWSFDGLLPRSVSSVSERTRTPVVAITLIAVLGIGAAAWIIWASNTAQVLALTTFMLVTPVVAVALSGLLLPSRLPDVFANGPANWRVRALPVLRIVSAFTLVLGLAWAFGLAYFHTEFGVSRWTTMPLVVIGFAVVAVVWYAVAVAVRRRDGVELKYVYRSIPPE